MRPDLLDAPLRVNWLPVTASVASPVASRQLIVPLYVPDRSVCSQPMLPLVSMPVFAAAAAAAAPRRRPRRPRRWCVPVVAIPPLFLFSAGAPPVLALASPMFAFAAAAARRRPRPRPRPGGGQLGVLLACPSVGL